MKMTLKARLSAVIGILSLLSVCIGLLGLYGMNQANDGLKTVYEDRTVALEQVSRIDRLLVQSQLALAEALEDSMVATIKVKSELIEKNIAQINQTWSVYIASTLTSKEQQLADTFAADRMKMIKEGLLPALTAMRDGNLADASQLQEHLQELVPAARTSVDALQKHQVDDAKKEYEQSSSSYAALRSTIVVAIAFGVLMAALVGFFLVRNVYRQLGGEPEYAAQIVRSIAAGDLTVTVLTKPDDRQSLLFAMKGMQQNLAQTVGEIRQSSDTIATASSQIAAGNLDLSSRTEQQASSLEETAASLEELTSTVKQNADHARQANELALSASKVALKGNAAVVQVVETMGSINASAKQIVDIISVIDSIAFQTNILALNAAVEAARAGEQGRGFAVVASEVRVLAQRSAGAAKEIKELISHSVEKTEAGGRLVEQAGATMEEIVESVKRVTDIMGEIAAASQEQHAGIENVNQAISQMDQVTQQNAALVEEAAAAAESLQNQAGNLAQLISVFNLDGRQADAGSGAAIGTPPVVGSVTRLSEKKTRAPAFPAFAIPVQFKRVANARSGVGGEWEEFCGAETRAFHDAFRGRESLRPK
jgi:methyl-accepting chemotaxis protein